MVKLNHVEDDIIHLTLYIQILSREFKWFLFKMNVSPVADKSQ